MGKAGRDRGIVWSEPYDGMNENSAEFMGGTVSPIQRRGGMNKKTKQEIRDVSIKIDVYFWVLVGMIVTNIFVVNEKISKLISFLSWISGALLFISILTLFLMHWNEGLNKKKRKLDEEYKELIEKIKAQK